MRMSLEQSLRSRARFGLRNEVEFCAQMPSCPCCGIAYKSWGHHLRYHPECGDSEDEDTDDDLPDLVERDSGDEGDDESLAELRRERARPKQSFGEGLMQDTIAADLLDLRYNHGFEESDIAHLKRYADKWVAMKEKLNGKQSSSLFAGLTTKKQEFARVRAKPGYIEPRRVSFGPHDVVSFDIAELLTRALQQNAAIRREAEQASNLFKSGSLHKKMPDVLDGILSGTAARFHPELMRTATDEESADFRVPLIFNLDDIEVRSIPTQSKPIKSRSDLPPFDHVLH